MAFLRPEVLTLFRRWSGVLEGGLVSLAGLWLISHPGWITLILGGSLTALGASWALLAWRRMRFAGDPSAPGLVEIDEGRLRFLHPTLGGEISLNDLADLHLLELQGRRVWRLKDLSGQAMLVPLEASGAERLFDALSALPGLNSAALVGALDRGTARATGSSLPVQNLQETRVWSRKGSGLRQV